MRRILICLLAGSLFSLPAPSVLAQGGTVDPCAAVTGEGAEPCMPIPIDPAALQQFLQQIGDPCQSWAAQNALPSLQMSYAFTPNGFGPYGWAPLTQPWGAGPIGPATQFAPPGRLPAYGPLGPGQTAFRLAATQIPPGSLARGERPGTNFTNTLTLVGLGALQQSELASMYSAYGNSAAFQQAGGFWQQAYAGQANATLQVMRGMCRGLHQQQAQTTGR